MVTKPADVERVYALCSISDRDTVTEAMRELLTSDYRPDLGKIKCPILVLGRARADLAIRATTSAGGKLPEPVQERAADPLRVLRERETLHHDR